MTLLTEAEIRAAGCVQIAQQDNYRATSYDLSINALIDEHGKQHEQICLEPGQMITVVSQEVLAMPPNITGVAHYLTRLTRKGVWSQTIGIIDPHWNGPLSTTIVNQSKSLQTLKKGDVYIRIAFFRHTETPNNYEAGSFTREKYTRQVERDTSTYMPRTFLNAQQLSEAAADSVFERIKASAITWLTIGGVFLAATAVIAGLLTNFAGKLLWEPYLAKPADAVAVIELQSTSSDHTIAIAKLEAEISELRRQITSLEASSEKSNP